MAPHSPSNLTLSAIPFATSFALLSATWELPVSLPTFPLHLPKDLSYYATCMVGGVVACGTTRTLITPLDVVKCNMQVSPAKFTGLMQGLRLVATEQGGVLALYKGWAPTALGYSTQGMCKFGFYELFRDTISEAVGPDHAYTYRGSIYLAAAASAECIADVALCPLEMIKVKMQTAPPGTFPLALRPALAAMMTKDTRFPFGSLVPLWSRQIPYTMAKFYCFERAVEALYTHVLTAPKESYSPATQLGVTFTAGYVAGIVCAVVSHPADSLVSLVSKPDNKGKSLVHIARETGFVHLATKGLGTRILIVGTLAGLQWWVYDSFKAACGLGTTGGATTARV
ncbi:Aste57867_1272 [Aphanomyces stellatus]|uniref:Aste57867_1272 protein n=1 Tax=Aphanomyces stellatus TaxID=120398 RepID=A0A485K904_9STRA|nr:hypothetical protein As57867_001271 [Aphanomyces stellatus]VFT78491.1 Aste57867_1272 [Aphanomyces stellatus]